MIKGKSKSGPSLILPVLSGLGLWLAFPEFSLFYLAWIALIPYLAFLIKKPGLLRLAIGHALFSIAYFAGILYWIPRVIVVHGGFGWPAALGMYLAVLLVLALFLAPFSLLVRIVAARSASAALLCAPSFWLLTEVIRNFWAVDGFPWALLGYSQYPYFWIIQIADVGGVYLVSFLIVLSNAALLGVWRLRQWRYLAVFATLLLLANAYGVYRCYLWRPVKTAELRVGMVQPDIALADKADHYATKFFETLPSYYRNAVADGSRLVIFPEAQNPYLYPKDFYYRTFLERMVNAAPAHLIFNSSFAEKDDLYFNSAFLLGRNGNPIFRYDKVHLVPFGEYVPAADWLDFLEPMVKEVSGFAAGREFAVAKVEGLTVGTMICYEGTFPEIAREFQRQGADVLVILTNDAWYGRTAAPEQHLQINAFRAIENRRMLLRATNSGYSAVIDELGRNRTKTRLYEEDLVVVDVSAYRQRTVYSYLGEWLNIVLIVLALPLALAAGKDKKGWQRPAGRRKGR